MQERRYDFRGMIAKRGLTGIVLVTFTLGNVGWPLDAGKSGPGIGCCAMTGKARCCCGLERSKSSCGCFKVRATAKTVKPSSCCQKKKRLAAEETVVVLNCDCGDSSFPGFIVSAQPRLAAMVIVVPGLTETSAVAAAAVPERPDASFPPETPPPRPSVS